MDTQFSRQNMLLGENSAEILSRAHVAVFGIGGVGSYCAEALARAGVGTLTLIDHDTVSESNLNRQLVALRSTVGQNKTDVMAARIADINPNCRIIKQTVFYEESNKDSLLTDDLDFIADAIDSVASKVSLIATAHERKIPIISSMGTGNRLDPSQFLITDLSKTSGCPLARVMRHELKKHGIVHHTVLSSTELPQKPQIPEGSAHVPGSVSWVPPSAGLMIAGHIIRALLAKTE